MRTSKTTVCLAALLISLCGAVADEVPLAGQALPGAQPFAQALQQKLSAAVDPAVEPRTRHRLADGSPRYVNRLIFETSPYLLQHAHNPVNWYPWGDEAFETAKRLGRPVLLSIGYSTCHWCHVMEEESFENVEIAAYLNANYVAIKVDREERPDIDAIYMKAVNLLTGRGGWPMTTWLTPAREPFYGGTYFPPRDNLRGARKGFLSVLRELELVYDEQPDQVALKAQEISRRVAAMLVPESGSSLPGAELIGKSVKSQRSRFDPENGGLKGSKKFPSSLPIRLLLRDYARTADASVLEMATLTLERMAAGGIHDQIGGGFHRYTVDARWRIPHFEKMLYDNALLAMAYLEAYQVTGRAELADVTRDVLDYVAREMTSPAGGFYSATDADSLDLEGNREEGLFFTWTPSEVDAGLPDKLAAPFRLRYGVDHEGNLDGRSVLHIANTAEDVAGQLGISVPELEQRLAAAREKLYRVRAKRPEPLLDDKVLTAWNGLMISAFARAGFALEDRGYLETASRAATFVLSHLRDEEGRLRRSFRAGRTRYTGYLDDYAFLIAALLDLYEATWDPAWIDEAIALQTILERDYADETAGGYFMTANDQQPLLAREKPKRDGVRPSGNSVALLNLLRLYELTTDAEYLVLAEALLRGFGGSVAGMPDMMIALDFMTGEPKEVVIVTAGSRRQAEPLLDVLRTTWVPNKVVVVAREGQALASNAERVPWVAGKVARDGQATAYVCRRGVCKLPTTDADVLRRQLREPRRAAE